MFSEKSESKKTGSIWHVKCKYVQDKWCTDTWGNFGRWYLRFHGTGICLSLYAIAITLDIFTSMNPWTKIQLSWDFLWNYPLCTTTGSSGWVVATKLRWIRLQNSRFMTLWAVGSVILPLRCALDKKRFLVLAGGKRTKRFIYLRLLIG